VCFSRGFGLEIEIGRGKKARRAYGFDDIAIVPSRRTRDAEDVDIAWRLGPHLLELPLLASAMDGVVSPDIAIRLSGADADVQVTTATPNSASRRDHRGAATLTPRPRSRGNKCDRKTVCGRRHDRARRKRAAGLGAGYATRLDDVGAHNGLRCCTVR